MRSAFVVALLVVNVFLPCALSSQSVVSPAPQKPHTANAVILLESSSAHAYGGNQEVYVADLRLAGKKDTQLAKLVDRYIHDGNRIDRSVLVAGRPLRLIVTRDPSCDVRANEVFLPADKQGDFDPEARRRLDEKGPEVLPCFLMDHNTARLGKR